MTVLTDYYEERLTELRERLIRILGVLTVNRLMERATLEIGKASPAVLRIRWDEDAIYFDEFRQALTDVSDEEVRETFTRLNAVLLLLVARLLGNEVARRLTQDVTLADAVDWRVLRER